MRQVVLGLAAVVVAAGVATAAACSSFGSSDDGSRGGSLDDAAADARDAADTRDASDAGEAGEAGDPAPRRPTTLVSDAGLTVAIAATEKNVYWTANVGYVRTTAIDGDGGVVDLASSQNPRAVTIAGSRVYWTDNSLHKVRSVDLSGGTPADAGATSAQSIAANASSIVVGNGPIGNVFVFDRPLSSPGTTFAGQGNVFDVAALAGATDYFWTQSDGHAVWHGTAINPKSILVASSDAENDCRSIAIGPDGRVYWTAQGTTEIRRAAPGGGTVTPVAKVSAGARSLAVDATGIYWLTPSTLERTKAAGAPIETLASGFSISSADDALGIYHRLALTSKYAVWLTDTDVLRVDKN